MIVNLLLDTKTCREYHTGKSSWWRQQQCKSWTENLFNRTRWIKLSWTWRC